MDRSILRACPASRLDALLSWPLPHTTLAFRAEKAGWQKTQKALEAQAERGRRATEEARARMAEQENAIRAVGMERRASLQER